MFVVCYEDRNSNPLFVAENFEDIKTGIIKDSERFREKVNFVKFIASEDFVTATTFDIDNHDVYHSLYFIFDIENISKKIDKEIKFSYDERAAKFFKI